ncbi:hypothetical protein METBIDRAFT_220035 [Metschnikowia bicuspidata var. bicuspidata NRRL YB-4993]|uniref:Uncharacterized protein n=1 Tax=Metschnikowia bicuspidata var. bicuspidata NRRL YB-4993 TaxID=869754 RepID=A0A1A0H5M2_9ASCO|nr:hypothetical protein METBIDRAFT_220035 [Metschnikowia bicuspidata var. bicuspidata NRRL YB-4993]OBA19197.1 hypothetical protein METBIDRAFT_220035 [Metschnikowia bicuspidata var. bicuspidata NRRL YB-4993]
MPEATWARNTSGSKQLVIRQITQRMSRRTRSPDQVHGASCNRRVLGPGKNMGHTEKQVAVPNVKRYDVPGKTCRACRLWGDSGRTSSRATIIRPSGFSMQGLYILYTISRVFQMVFSLSDHMRGRHPRTGPKSPRSQQKESGALHHRQWSVSLFSIQILLRQLRDSSRQLQVSSPSNTRFFSVKYKILLVSCKILLVSYKILLRQLQDSPRHYKIFLVSYKILLVSYEILLRQIQDSSRQLQDSTRQLQDSTPSVTRFFSSVTRFFSSITRFFSVNYKILLRQLQDSSRQLQDSSRQLQDSSRQLQDSPRQLQAQPHASPEIKVHSHAIYTSEALKPRLVRSVSDPRRVHEATGRL